MKNAYLNLCRVSFYCIGLLLLLLFNPISGFTQHDLSLVSGVNKDSVGIGDTVTFQLILINEGHTNLSTIQIQNNIPSGLDYISHQPNTANFNSDTGIWSIANMPSSQDSLVLELSFKANAMGLSFNIAEILSQDGDDSDSAPNNQIITEDDYTNTCVSVPILSGCNDVIDVLAEAPSGYAGYQWYRDGMAILGATDDSLVIIEPGKYTFSTTGEACDADLCCPIIVQQTACLGDTTFVDVNGNGLQDSGDQPLANVTATLYDATTGNLVMTNAFGNTIVPMLTDANGYYLFDSLAPGEYYVVFDATTAANGNDYVPTQMNINGGNLDGQDSDVGVDFRSDTTMLTYGESDFSLDAGFLIPVAVGDTTFVDANGNGLQDGADSALEGVTITLYDAITGLAVSSDVNGNPIMPIQTSVNGAYLFDSLYPGQYYVEFDVTTATNGNNYVATTANISGGTSQTTDSDIGMDNRSDTTAFLMSGTMDFTLDAGWYLPVSIGDTTFVDVNSNGLQDNGDTPLAGVTATLYDATKGLVVSTDAYGNPVVPLVTNMDGFYQFDSLPPGQYFVEFDVTTATDGNLYLSTTENVNGTNLSPNDSDLNELGRSDTTAFLLSGQVDNTLDAGFYLPVSVGNLVWEDSNNDGVFNSNESGIDGVEVILFQLGADNTKGTSDDIGLDTVLTAGGGLYLFDNLFPGNYYLKLNGGIPTGMISATGILNDTLNTEPANDPDNNVNNEDNGTQMGAMVMSEVFSLGVGNEPTNDGDTDSSTNLSVDFGLFTPLSIGNLVWEDLDNNGQKDSGESGIADVEVILFEVGPDGQKEGRDDLAVDTLLTDSNGHYLFDSLGTGTYYVKLNSGIPAGMYSATGTGADGSQAITYEPGAMTDDNSNNDDDGTQMGSMIMSDTLLLVKNTEPDNDDDTDTNTNLSVDFGLIRYLSIGNLVWEDSDNDGQFNNGEAGLGNIKIQLYQAGIDGVKGTNDDVLLDSMLTGSGGLYLFDSLSPGAYYIKLAELNAGIISSTGEGTNTITGAGTYEPAIDPDINATNNDDNGTQVGYGDTTMVMSDLILLNLSNEPVDDGDVDSTSNLSVDFGLIQTLQIGNLVWEDLDNDGLAGMDEPGIADVELILYAVGADGVKGGNDDLEIKRDTTDADGQYLFDFITEGTYYVKINSGIPVGMNSATGEGVDGTDTNTYEPFMGTDNNVNNDDDGTQMGNMIMSDTFNLARTAEPITDGDTDNNTNLSIDFGLFETLSIGNLVWEDLNNDGIADATEPKLANIELTLFKDGGDGIKGSNDDIEIGKDTTDNNGNYLFAGLYPDDYYITINDLPLGMISSTGEGINNTTGNGTYEPAPDADSNTDNLDDGTFTNGMVMSSLITLNLYDEPTNDGDTNNSTNLSVDFGLFQTLVLGNLVWEDLNNNGLVDPNEPGMEDIEVVLYRDIDGTKGNGDDVEIQRDTTGADGEYMFINLDAGMYYVKLNNIPLGYMSSTGEGTATITGSGAYEPAPDADVYADNDDNGTQMTMPDGSIMVMSDLISMVLYNEQTDSVINMDVDFGLYNTLEAGNFVWEDLNNNGLVDAGEPGINGVEVIIYQTSDGTKGNGDDVEIGRDTTDTNGMYLFQSLEPGDYWVKLNSGIPDGFRSSTGEGTSVITGTGTFEPASMLDDNIDDNDDGTGMLMPDGNYMVMSDIVSLDLYEEPDNNSIANYRIDFGLFETMDLGNLVWEDTNNDGIKDVAENGLSDIEVILYEPGPDGIACTTDDSEVAKDTTDVNGAYLFENLNANDYFITLNNLPDGLLSSTGEGTTTADGTGNYEPASNPNSDIDNADDGTDATLADGTPIIKSDIFSLVLYHESITDGDADSTTNYTVDFGLFESLELGNLVWEDVNNNGVVDNGESGIGEVEVILYLAGTDGQVGTADDVEMARDTTDTNGNYLFADLYPNEYFVKLNDGIPTGFVSATGEGAVTVTGTGTHEPAADPDATNTNNDDDGTQMGNMVMSDLVSLVLYDEPTNDGDTNNTTNYAVDFGLYELLSLGNLVWEDLNNDGLANNNEPGFADIEVVLYRSSNGTIGDADDVLVAKDTTDTNGGYLFEGLTPGDYYVKLNEGIPPYTVSSTGEGIVVVKGNGTYEPAVDPDDTNTDNDDNGSQMNSMIISELVSLNLDDEPTNDADTNDNTNTTVDFGLIRKLEMGGVVWTDANNNGIIDPQEEGFENIEVVLMMPGPDGIPGTADDIEVDRMMVNDRGEYMFDGLFPDKYFVKLENIPAGMASSDGNGFGGYTGDGPYEGNLDPNNDMDSDDNGSQTNPTTIISGIVDLILYDEPTNDDDNNDNTNTTIDFGLTPTNLAYIYDPCNCLGNESSQGAGDGQFSDRIVILSSVGGETWSLTAQTGMYALNSPNPPAAPSLIPLGTIAIPDGRESGFYRYVLDLRHIDRIGYGATFSNGVGTLSVSNLCTYEGSCNFVSTDTDATPGVNPTKQTFVMGPTNTPKVDSLMACDKESMFMDDGLNDGLYVDTAARNNIYTICPQNSWQQLNFVFTQFSTAAGDSLSVYDGRNTSAPLIGKFGGEGVSQTSGWVATSCEPSINPSGCLTFRFQTNGDNAKGNGWMGNFECSERSLTLTPPNISPTNLTCSEVIQTITINPATIAANCGTVQDSQLVRIYDPKGIICKDTCIAFDKNFQETFTLGSYRIEYKLKSDTTKTTQAVLSVQAPSLVCNDEITVPLGSGCSIALTPDDLLENPCDTITDTMYYHITLAYTDKKGEIQTLSGGGKGGNYPVLTKEMLGDCGTTVNATIERRYFEGLTLNICNNGQVSASCTVQVNALDQTAPWITDISEIDTFITCNIDLTQAGLGLPTPTAVDNCSEPTVTFVGANIIAQGSEICDTSRAEVTWKASDACGNEMIATQMVVFIRPSLEDVVKTGKVILSCNSETTDGEVTKVPGIKIGKLKNGVLIPTDTIDLSTENYTCGYILQKRDIAIPAVDCGKKVFRYWSVLDWCDSEGGIKPIDTTFIEYKDTKPPQFVAGTGENTILELDHFSCTYDITKVNQPEATDNCSKPSVRLAKVSRIEDGKEWPIEQSNWASLDCDSFQLQWIAEDDCHEQLVNDTLEQIVEIKDLTKPSAVCTDKINLSLARDEAKLHYKDIDSGSSDACGIAEYEVSRDEVNWDSTVVFTCADAHAAVKVYLRVTDKKGNQSTCWMEVNVEDKIRPICSDLADRTESCDAYHSGELGMSTDINENGLMEENEWVSMTEEQVNLFNTKYGHPSCSDNITCQDLSIEQEYQLMEKKCGEVKITRRYRAIDWAGEGLTSNWAMQNIHIETKPNWTITLPADWKGQCGDGIPDSEVLIENGPCDLMAYEVEEKTFTVIEDACLKVVRTFTIINWCTYQTEGETAIITRVENEHGMATSPLVITAEGNEEVGRFQYTQILKVQDATAPVIIVNETDNCLAGSNCEANKQFSITATDCNEAATNNLTYNWTISSSGEELASGVGATFDYLVVPKVTYDVKWMVADNCGNTAWEEVSYDFWDCKKPSPYCLNGVAVELMTDAGMIQIWAKDIERNSSDNCTPQDKLDFRIWHANLGAEPTTDKGIQALPKVITFDCTTLGTQTVNLYVIDEEGNWDFCVTYVNVQDNMGACNNIETPEDMAFVSGTIMDWKEQTVEEVEVKTTNTLEVMTQADGQYRFELAMGQDYTIVPSKLNQPLNGVSTFDLVLISKHILGITPFENPYQMIAADVNKSGTVTAFDMVQLRQLILNITSEFSNNTSWRFVETNYEFQTDNPLNENFSEVGVINDLSQAMDIDFVAIKIGDVNGNARPNNLAVAEERTAAKTFEIETEDKELKAGETYTFNFSTKQLNEIQGYQFTLAYDHLKVEKLKSGVAGVENFGLHKMEDGYITTSWNQTAVDSKQSAENPQSTTLFTVEFTALHNGKLSEQLSILNRPTPIEAYDEKGNLMEVQLTFTTPLYNEEFVLLQNTPNPFREKTEIGFYLPGDSEVQLILRDETGRIIKSYKAEYGTGYNSIQLNKEEVMNGFIYYQLSTKFGTKAKKMLRLD